MHLQTLFNFQKSSRCAGQPTFLVPQAGRSARSLRPSNYLCLARQYSWWSGSPHTRFGVRPVNPVTDSFLSLRSAHFQNSPSLVDLQLRACSYLEVVCCEPPPDVASETSSQHKNLALVRFFSAGSTRLAYIATQSHMTAPTAILPIPRHTLISCTVRAGGLDWVPCPQTS